MSHQFLLALKPLYAINGIIGVSLYIPQIVSAWKDKNKALSLSLMTFGGWCISALITVLYALYFAHDKLMAGLSLANMVAAGALFLLILQTRLQAVKSGSGQSPSSGVVRAPYRQHGTSRGDMAARFYTQGARLHISQN